MALRPVVSKHNLKCSSPTLTCHLNPSFQSRKTPKNVIISNMSRREVIAVITLAREAIFNEGIAYGLDLRMVAPEQTIEEAESGIKDHTQALLQVKALIESKSWDEAQRALRKSSSYLKQDIYTIIQGKPASERPQLRKLYSNLFSNVTK